MPGQGSERGKLLAQDALLNQLRAQYPDRRIIRTPWGYSAFVPRTGDELQAPTLDELAMKLEGEDPQ